MCTFLCFFMSLLYCSANDYVIFSFKGPTNKPISDVIIQLRGAEKVDTFTVGSKFYELSFEYYDSLVNFCKSSAGLESQSNDYVLANVQVVEKNDTLAEISFTRINDYVAFLEEVKQVIKSDNDELSLEFSTIIRRLNGSDN